MATWTVIQAKQDFDRGLLTGFEIHDSSAIMTNVQHWSISFTVKLGEAGALVDTRGNGPRQFRTLDAAVGVLRDIGFQVKQLHSR